MKRTAQSIEERKSVKGLVFVGKRKCKPRGKPFAKGNKIGNRFKPGESGNPTGKPGTDLFALQARALAERHPISAEGFASLADELKGFNAYGFSVVADRGYGKVKETHEVVGEEGSPVEIVVKLVKA